MDSQQIKRSLLKNINAIDNFIEKCKETMFCYEENKNEEILLTEWAISVYEYNGEILDPTGNFMYFAWLKTRRDQLKTLYESADFAIKQYHNLNDSDDLIISSHDINFYRKDKPENYDLMLALQAYKDSYLLDLEKEIDKNLENLKPRKNDKDGTQVSENIYSRKLENSFKRLRVKDNPVLGRLIYLMQKHKIFPSLPAYITSEIFQKITGTSEHLRQFINDGKDIEADEKDCLISKLELVIRDLKAKR